MTASDALRNFIAPLLPGWRIQFGRWVDGANTDRYAVIRPAGGMPAELVRRPQFSLMLIGALDDAAQIPETSANALVEAMRASSGNLVFLQPAEPVFWATADGRPVFEIAISAITN
ncbi:hypothetical protein N0K08_17390 [Acidovorax sp. Be4]|uniref:Uncharacterized protein n=1 Tax=Acidovorax bellezanensis TaxID=2976702 RepID=A0ABT2PQ81_9BURK|nr:hypothetical protein [Acidovorax sp. Be4]MCT9812420.1 hypothetical protein [Acidovorax sp. Be4]